MSEELRDLRCKIPSQLDDVIEAEAAARGIDKCEVVREVLMGWGRIRHSAYMEYQRRLANQGTFGESRGSSGRQSSGARIQSLSWDDK